MYRHAGQVGAIAAVSNYSLPSPDHTSDSESDLLDILDRKRRQLDDEIATFKAVKDKEFAEFEKALRQKRKRDHRYDGSPSPSSTNGSNNHNKNSNNRVNGSALSLLAGAKSPNSRTTGVLNSQKKSLEYGLGIGYENQKTNTSLLGKPTLSLDRCNIEGETAPAATLSETPPTSENLTKKLSRSPSNPAAIAFTPPRTRERAWPKTSSHSSANQSDSFAGVFVPSYLPLLESPDNSRTNTPQEPNRTHRPSSFSLPRDSIVPPSLIAHAKRAQTLPTLSSSSLPSALRTASGTTVRKRKHVTFQLADSAIVEPSSSYEELPSPNLAENHGNGFTPKQVTSDGDSDKNGKRSEVDWDSEASSGNNQTNGSGKSSSFKPTTRRPLSSPPLRSGQEDTAAYVQQGLAFTTMTGFSRGLDGADDGGSVVGFFELDEELISPKTKEDDPFEPVMEDGDHGTDGADDTASPELDETDGVGISTKVGKHANSTAAEDGYEIAPGSFTAGSVPINIIRPSGSWVGSFGH